MKNKLKSLEEDIRNYTEKNKGSETRHLKAISGNIEAFLKEDEKIFKNLRELVVIDGGKYVISKKSLRSVDSILKLNDNCSCVLHFAESFLEDITLSDISEENYRKLLRVWNEVKQDV